MKKAFLALGLIVLSASVALLAFELFLRAIGYSAPAWYRADAQLGWRLRPGTSGLFTQEGRAFVSVSAQGLRDRPHRLEKPPRVYRIVVLGDSYSEAMQVPLASAYWAQLPERLEACGFQSGKQVEVVNFGVAGYGTAQQYLMLKSVALRYRPDMVLWQFTNGNDVVNNSFALEEERNRPFFLLDRRGALLLDDSFASGPEHRRRASRRHALLLRLTDHARVLQLLRAVRRIPLFGSGRAAAEGEEPGLAAAVLAEPRDPLWKEAWRVTEALLVQAHDTAVRNGARFLLVTVPYAIQVHPDRAMREGLQAKLGAPDLFYPDRRIASFAKKQRIDVLTLAPHMQRLSEAGDGYLYGFDNARPGFGHWNESGHRAAAELIARHLCAPRR